VAKLKPLITEVALPERRDDGTALQLLYKLYNDDVPKPRTEETIMVAPLPGVPSSDEADLDEEESEESDDEEDEDDEEEDEDDEEESDDVEENAPG